MASGRRQSAIYDGSKNLEEGTKLCRSCKETKPLDSFSAHKSTRDGRRSYCKACGVEQNRAWKKDNPDWELTYRLQRRYGLSIESYFDLLNQQGNKCSICKTEFGDSLGRRLCVDHCHDTNRVRGLLCFNCNTVLGKVKDSVETLQAAIDYLQEGGN